MEKKYSMSYDLAAKIITILFIVFTIGCIVYVLKDFISEKHFEITDTIGIFLLLSIGFIAYLLSPKYYIVDDDYLIIVTAIKKIKVAKIDIADLILLNPVSSKMRVKLFASGGFLGYFGYYSIAGYGNALAYTSRLDNQILVETKNGKYVISPDDINIINDLKINLNEK